MKNHLSVKANPTKILRTFIILQFLDHKAL